MKRPAIAASGNRPIGIASLPHSKIVGDCHSAKKLRIVLLQPSQIHFRQFNGFHLLRANQFRKLCHLPERNVLEILGPLDFRRRAHSNRPFRPVYFGAWENGIEIKRRRDCIFERDFSQLAIVGEIFVHAHEHFVELLVGELESRNGRSIAQHCFRDGDVRSFLIWKRRCCPFPRTVFVSSSFAHKHSGKSVEESPRLEK